MEKDVRIGRCCECKHYADAFFGEVFWCNSPKECKNGERFEKSFFKKGK